MTRKWKPKPATRTRLVRLDGDPHAHACVVCGGRYEDNCRTSSTDGTCNSCRHGHPWPLWRTTRLPQTCCRSSSRKATADEIALHRLGGQATWWLCTTCHRTHPYNPTQDQEQT